MLWRGKGGRKIRLKRRQKPDNEGLVFHVKDFRFCATDDRKLIKDFKKRCDIMRFVFYKCNSVSILYA